MIEAHKENNRRNPCYEAGSRDWRKNREFIGYTSSSVNTAGKKEFLYGRFEVHARIPVAKGAWPAIWTLGSSAEWPLCGEIDILEYYQIKGAPHILANAAWGTDERYVAKWNSKRFLLLISRRKMPVGPQSFTSGGWTGTKKLSSSIWTMSY